MKIWVDDVRPAPEGYDWFKSVEKAKDAIIEAECVVDSIDYKDRYTHDPLDWTDCCLRKRYTIELIDIDHDAGEYVSDGGDYIRLLDWMEKTGRSYPIRIHSMNPVGVENMRRIIQRNDWEEVM